MDPVIHGDDEELVSSNGHVELTAHQLQVNEARSIINHAEQGGSPSGAPRKTKVSWSDGLIRRNAGMAQYFDRDTHADTAKMKRHIKDATLERVAPRCYPA